MTQRAAVTVMQSGSVLNDPPRDDNDSAGVWHRFRTNCQAEISCILFTATVGSKDSDVKIDHDYWLHIAVIKRRVQCFSFSSGYLDKSIHLIQQKNLYVLNLFSLKSCRDYTVEYIRQVHVHVHCNTCSIQYFLHKTRLSGWRFIAFFSSYRKKKVHVE